MKVNRTAKFFFSGEEIEKVRKLICFFDGMNDQDYEDLKEAANFNGHLYESLDNLYSFMCENPE